MPNLGRKYNCYSCHTKFYDLGKPVPLCPKCGADQRDSEQTPVVTSHRSRRAPAPVVIEEPAEEPEFGNETEADSESEAEAGEDEVVEVEKQEPEEEEEEY